MTPTATDGSLIVEQVLSFMLLGLFISEDLTRNIHCDYVLKKSNKRLYILRQLLEYASVFFQISQLLIKAC